MATRLLVTALGCALALLIGVGAASYYTLNRQAATAGGVLHTQEVRTALAAMLSMLTDAETGQRGYLITGDEHYLEPYNSGVADLGNAIQRLRLLMADNSAQQQRLAVVERLVAARVARLEQVLNLRRAGDVEGARRGVLTGQGKQLMDDLRRAVAEMEAAEQTLLRQRTDDANRATARAKLFIAAGSLFAVLITTLAILALVAELRRRRRAEAALQQHNEQLEDRVAERAAEVQRVEARWRITLKSIGDAVISTDAAGRVSLMNNVAEDLTGWAQAEAAGHSLEEVFRIVNEQTRAVVENPLIRVIREGVIVGLANHTILLAKDGREFPIDDSGAPIRDEAGQIVGAVLVFRDITERKQVDDDLRRSEERLELAVGATNLGIWDADLRTNQYYWSPRTYEIHGLVPETPITPELIASLFHPDDWPLWRRAVRAAYDPQGSGELNLEYRFIRPDGTQGWVVVQGYADFAEINGERRAIRLTGSTRDITERKAAEAEILQNAERFRQLGNSLPQLVWTCEPDGTCDFLSQQWVEYTGIPEAEQLGFRWLEQLHPDDREPTFAAWNKTVETGTDLIVEFRIRRYDGVYRPFDTRATRLLDAEGNTVKWFGFNIDITERKRQENELRESEERYYAATAAVSGVMWTNNADGLMEGEQRGWGEFTGQSREEYQGYGWSKTVHPEDAQPTIDAWIQAVAEKRAFVFEHRIRRHDSEWRVCSIRAVPVLNADGTIREWVGVHADITERKQAEEELKASEEFNRTVLESSPDCIKILDGEGRLQYINVNGLCLMEIDDFASFQNEFWWNLWVEESQPLVKDAVAKALRGETVKFEAYRPTAKGTPKWWDIIVSPIPGVDGKPNQLISVSRDITELKRAEAERERLLREEQRARETAEAHNRAKDDFLAVVSHELRSPLSAILGYTRITRMSAHDAAVVTRNCEIIERNAKVQQQLIEDLLDTARIISGKLKIEAEPTDLRLVLEEALTVVRPAAEAKRIDLVARLGDEPQEIIGDAARLGQIAWNLLQNAIKFTPDGGRVELRLERDGSRVRIVVSDTGKGIEPEFLSSVFDRFSQQDATRTRRFGGLGLGLALVKQLAEMHGGTVAVASAGVGMGATFTVTLPLRATKIAAYLPPVPALAEIRIGPDIIPLDSLPRLDGVRVLLVDDQEDTRRLVSATLDDWGAAVTMAASGAEARAMIASAAFDVLVCDIAMPDEDGYQVIGRIRALERERGVPLAERLPAIALTALARAEDRLQAMSAGFQMHVAKPVELAELVVVIATMVGNRQSGSAVRTQVQL